VVDADVESVIIEADAAGRREIGLIERGAGICGGNQLEEVLRLSGETAGGDPVSRELGARGGGAGERVKNVDTGGAKIARAFEVAGNAEERAATGVAASALIIAKVEELIFDSRAADGCAKLVPLG